MVKINNIISRYELDPLAKMHNELVMNGNNDPWQRRRDAIGMSGVYIHPVLRSLWN